MPSESNFMKHVLENRRKCRTLLYIGQKHFLQIYRSNHLKFAGKQNPVWYYAVEYVTDYGFFSGDVLPVKIAYMLLIKVKKGDLFE